MASSMFPLSFTGRLLTFLRLFLYLLISRINLRPESHNFRSNPLPMVNRGEDSHLLLAHGVEIQGLEYVFLGALLAL